MLSKQEVMTLIKSVRESGSQEAKERLNRIAAHRIEANAAHKNHLVWMARSAVSEARRWFMEDDPSSEYEWEEEEVDADGIY